MLTEQENILSLSEIHKIGEHIALWRPLSTEQREYHASQAILRWLMGGNQSGKSYANMLDLAMVALGVHPYRKTPKNALYWAATESWEMVRDILWEQYLDKFIPKNRIVHIDWGSGKEPRKIHIDNGNIIQLKAFNQKRVSFQGRAIDGFYGDEQCLHDFMGIFQEVQARLLKKEGFLSWSMTPIIPQMEFEERIAELPETDAIFYLDLNDNRISRGGYISDERIDAKIADWADEVLLTRVEGKFSSYLGAVFKTFNRSIHVIDPFEIPEDWEKYRGIDFGYSAPFACIWLAKDGDDNWYVYREYYKNRTGIQDHIRAIKQLSGDEKYRSTVADPEDPEGRADLRKAGIINIAADKGAGSVNRGIELMQSKLKIKQNGKPSLSILRPCRNTSKEFSVYRYPDNERTDHPVKENDHCLDAVRYVLYTMLKPRKKGRVLFTA